MSTNEAHNDVLVSWEVDEIEVPATLTCPPGKGPFPAVIFVAGSGPTDRNWNTPLVPGTNGSGALLARVLTENGFITLRYDKRASGPKVQENIKQLVGKISMHGHLEELAGGVDLLARRQDVDASHIFVLTNSEGCVHGINYQTQSPAFPFAGMVLTSAFARPAGDLARNQIAAQLEAVPGGGDLLAAYDTAIKDFLAGRPVEIDEHLPEALRMVIIGVTQPVNQPFSRELWAYDPTKQLTKVGVPVLIVLGKKDIQVDWAIDGPLFENVARKYVNIEIVYMENANHVLKYEPKPRPQITPADAMATYSADTTQLDPDTSKTIITWLKSHL
jgi:pimeloyl-ACP methyl ester carboxylesterase